MCGIAGIFKPTEVLTLDDLVTVRRMVELQSHRGPDASGAWHDGHFALGHTRLAIIDLSPAGRQPMTNEDGTVQVIYNGEIYNYRELHAELKAKGHTFRSNSDTEAIVHGYEQWGMEGLLARLRGMFALAIYDQPNRKCILARDRYGIKPLYYRESPDGALVFASEVKTLVRSAAVPNGCDREGITGFLLFGSVPAPRTSIRGVNCLLPGHYLKSDPRGIAIGQYGEIRSSAEAAAELKPVLEDALARHLISDVPLGVFLSGGVDSAGLVALASRKAARLSTLTVVFDEEEFSEAAPARRVAERFHTDHREIRVTADDFIAELPNVIDAMDQPTNDGVNTYFVSRAARQAGLTVVLSGLGGDEVFWGYRHYHWLSRHKTSLRWLHQAPAVIRAPLAAGAAAYGRARGRENWMRLAPLGRRVANQDLYLAFRGFFAPEQVARLMDLPKPELEAIVEANLGGVQPEHASTVPSAQGVGQIESRRYLHDQLLRDTDVFSMAHSIEVRVPYLDREVMHCAAALPDARKVNGSAVNKPALVNAIDDPLVLELAKQQKRGFSFPFARWMRLHAPQLQEMSRQSDLLDRGTVDGMWRAFTQGRLHWSRAWALAVLGSRAGSASVTHTHAVC
jgi:asparagine synthase (glutamine-hydrolysing)